MLEKRWNVYLGDNGVVIGTKIVNVVSYFDVIDDISGNIVAGLSKQMVSITWKVVWNLIMHE